VATRTEIRWFVPGGVDGCRRPPGRAVVRADLYQCSTLTPSRSVKLRGRATLEHKVRTGRVELVEIGALRGFAETWLKIDAAGVDVQADGPWVKVRKELWRAGGVEVGRVDVGGQRWWTVCVDAAVMGRRSAGLLEGWSDVLIAHGQPHSYASWILELQRARSARRRR
jgi:hypothetical protein